MNVGVGGGGGGGGVGNREGAEEFSPGSVTKMTHVTLVIRMDAEQALQLSWPVSYREKR